MTNTSTGDDRVTRMDGPGKGPKPDDLVLYSECSPEANGKQPQAGSANYCFTVPLDDGRTAWINVGVKGFKAMSGIIHAIESDEAQGL